MCEKQANKTGEHSECIAMQLERVSNQCRIVKETWEEKCDSNHFVADVHNAWVVKIVFEFKRKRSRTVRNECVLL